MGKLNILLRPFLLLALGFLVVEELHGQCPYVVPVSLDTAICPNELVQVTGFVPRGNGLLRTQIWVGTDAIANAGNVQDSFRTAFSLLDTDNLPLHPNIPSIPSLTWPMVGINYLPGSPTAASSIQYNWPACDTPNCSGNANDNYAQGVEQAQQDGWLLIPDAVSCIRFSFSGASNKAAALYLSDDSTLGNLVRVLACNVPNGTLPLTADWTVPSGLPGGNTGFRYTRLRLYHHDAQGLADTEVKWDIGDGLVTIPRAFFQSVDAPNSITNPPAGIKADKSFFAYRDSTGPLFLREPNHSIGPPIVRDTRYKQAVTTVRTGVLTGSGCDTVAECGEPKTLLIYRYAPGLLGGSYVQYWDPDSTFFDQAPGAQDYRESFRGNDNLGLPEHARGQDSGLILNSNFLGFNLPANVSAVQRTMDAWLAVPPDISYLAFQLGSGNGTQSSALWLGKDLSNMSEVALEVSGEQSGGAYHLPANLDTTVGGWRWLRARLYVHDEAGPHDSRVKWDLGEGFEYIPRNFIRTCITATENTISPPNLNFTLNDIQYGILLPDGTVWVENGNSIPNQQIPLYDWLDERVDTLVIGDTTQQPVATIGPSCVMTYLADPCNRHPIAIEDTWIVVQGLRDTSFVLQNDTDPDTRDIPHLHITQIIGVSPSVMPTIISPDSVSLEYNAALLYVGDFDLHYVVCDDGDTNLCDTARLHIVVDKDADADHIADRDDKDSDNDGISNLLESANARNFGDTDGDAVPDSLDLDSDNDGSPDIVENGMEDPNNDGRVPIKADSTLMHDENDNGWDDNAERLDSIRLGRALDSDGDGVVPNYLDLDSDDDGIYDIIEKGLAGRDSLGMMKPPFFEIEDGWDERAELQLERDLDGDSELERIDLDSDNDGIPNIVEAKFPDEDNDGMLDNLDDADFNGADDNRMHNGVDDQDGDGIPNYLDLDSDNDGIADLVEDGHLDPDSLGRFALPLQDTNHNGWQDLIPRIGTRNHDTDSLPDFLDLDSDNDGLYDRAEQMALTDTNVAKVPSFLDTLHIGWNILDAVHRLQDHDGDGIPDRIDLDADNDGIPDVVEAGGIDITGSLSVPDGMIDNFVDSGSNGADDSRMHPKMLHHDEDSLPDYLDLDADNDGIVDFDEDSGGRGAPSGTVIPDSLTALVGWAGHPRLTGLRDTDRDSVPDRYDLDSDNDGIYDLAEAWPLALVQALDSLPLDGRLDALQTPGGPSWDPTLASRPAINTDLDRATGDPSAGDNLPDYIDLDSDNDGLADIFEDSRAWPSNDSGQFSPSLVHSEGIESDSMRPVRHDFDGDGVPDFRDLDSDNDGIADAIEAGYTDHDGKLLPADGMADGPVNALGWRDLIMPGSIDQDGDGLPPHLDRDSDNDGIPDLIEANGVYPQDSAYILVLQDLDGNGWDDTRAAHAPFDSDGDGTYDFLDSDSDDDGITDLLESKEDAVDGDADGMVDNFDNDDYGWDRGQGTTDPWNTDGDFGVFGLPLPDYRDLDSDEDGISDNDELLFGIDGIDCDKNGIVNWRDSLPCDVHFYAGFSPNGDGINDEFIVEGIAYRQDNVFTVMNRWGVMIYKAEGWDGTWTGNCNVGLIGDTTPAPVGIYFYTFQYGAERRQFQKGYIYLRR